VLTADKIPSKIAGLEERLRSRFEWGIMAKVEIPELETKIAIIKKKCELNGIELDNDIVEYLATQFGTSIREIEGIIININAHASLLNSKITLEFVQDTFKDLIEKQKENINLKDIIDVVASELNIKPSDIRSKKRTAVVANARRIVIYLTKEHTHNSMQIIAQELGMKDYSSVSKSISKANELIEKDENFRLNLENLKNKIVNKG
jgi:chromosomal replication initiator protein